ncbi:MAG: hypothetical protein V8T86_10595 [Victivallis sp.]
MAARASLTAMELNRSGTNSAWRPPSGKIRTELPLSRRLRPSDSTVRRILARIVSVDADGVHRPHRLAQKRNRKGVALDDVGEVEPGRDDRIQHKALHRAHMIPREHERAVSGGEVFKSAQVDFRSAALEDIDVLFAEPDLLPAAQQAVFRLSADPVEVLPDLQVKVQPAVQEKAGAQVAPVVRRIVAVF